MVVCRRLTLSELESEEDDMLFVLQKEKLCKNQSDMSHQWVLLKLIMKPNV